MTRQILTGLALLCSSAAFAAAHRSPAPDFTILNADRHPVAQRQDCLNDAWRAAHPSDAQNQQANDFMTQAKEVLDAEKDAIRESSKDLFGAWKKHPISQPEVEAAEAELKTHLDPVHSAIQNAVINTLNLLSADQRAAFDDSMMSCMHHGQGGGGRNTR